jgi:hypothetical protein
MIVTGLDSAAIGGAASADDITLLARVSNDHGLVTPGRSRV